MKTFAQFNDAGLPIAFYNEDVHGALTQPVYRDIPVYGDVPEATEDNSNPVAPVIGVSQEQTGTEPNPDCKIPSDAIEITKQQWINFINNQGCRKWLDGEVVAYDPPPSPPIIPSSASKLGLIRAFKEQGAWASIKSMIAADDDVQEEWEAATEIRRVDPITEGMIAALKLTDKQVDALLIRANELVA